jgi:hypothetical protein
VVGPLAWGPMPLQREPARWIFAIRTSRGTSNVRGGRDLLEVSKMLPNARFVANAR